jgi:hypothetical protein
MSCTVQGDERNQNKVGITLNTLDITTVSLRAMLHDADSIAQTAAVY